MGKINSVISFTGRVGNLVGRKGPDGRTLVQPYQPTVINPQTSAQLIQRAKVNLAGQLSAITPAGAIAPLGMGSKAKNRSEFMKLLLKRMSAQLTAEGYAAGIPARDIVFSHGDQQAMATVGSPTYSATTITVPLTARTYDETVDTYGERIVVVIAGVSTAQKFNQVFYKDTLLSSGAQTTVTLDIPVTLTEEKAIYVYRIPFVLSDTGRSLLAGEGLEADEVDIAAVIARQNTAVKDWGETIYVTSSVFTPGQS